MSLFEIIGKMFGGFFWFIYNIIKLPIFITVEALYFVAALLITPLALIAGPENVKNLWHGIPLIFEAFYVDKRKQSLQTTPLIASKHPEIESHDGMVSVEISASLFCPNCGNQYTDEMKSLLNSNETTYCEYCGNEVGLPMLTENSNESYA